MFLESGVNKGANSRTELSDTCRSAGSVGRKEQMRHPESDGVNP